MGTPEEGSTTQDQGTATGQTVESGTGAPAGAAAASGASAESGADSGDKGALSDQTDVMADVLDLAGGGKPAAKEPAEKAGRPDAAKADGAKEEKTGLSDAQTQSGKEDDGKTAGENEDKKGDGQDAAGDKAKDDHATPDTKKKEDEQLVEVATEDGVRKVPLKNLVTTYTQYRHLQALHAQAKPIFDLSKGANVPMQELYPYLVLGIQTAARQRDAMAHGQEPSQPAGGDKGYQGPFKDAEEDARIKEIDPSLHASQWNVFNRAVGVERQLTQIMGMLNRGGQNGGGQSDTQRIFNETKAAVEKKISDWAGEHKDYFALDPQTGISQRMEQFKAFLGNKYGHLDIDDLSPEILAIAFQTFDPDYVTQYMQAQASKKAADLLAEQNATFGESSNARSGSPVKQLTEQQEFMKDVL